MKMLFFKIKFLRSNFVEHVRGLEELVQYYDQEARDYHQRRDQKKADLFLTKKKLVLKEVRHRIISSIMFSSFVFFRSKL